MFNECAWESTIHQHVYRFNALSFDYFGNGGTIFHNYGMLVENTLNFKIEKFCLCGEFFTYQWEYCSIEFKCNFTS